MNWIMLKTNESVFKLQWMKLRKNILEFIEILFLFTLSNDDWVE